MTVKAPPRPPRSDEPPDLEALIEEARRRARRRWRMGFAAFVLLCALVGTALYIQFGTGNRTTTPGSPSSRNGNAAGTRLTFIAVNSNVGRAIFHLSCSPPGGDVPSPQRACAALRRKPRVVLKPKIWTCVGGMFSWWDIKITGHLGSRPVETKMSTCWTPQMEMIGRLLSAKSSDSSSRVLRAHLLPRRHVTLRGKSRRTFEPGMLHPGDLVTCRYRGRKIDQGVENRRGAGGGDGLDWGQRHPRLAHRHLQPRQGRYGVVSLIRLSRRPAQLRQVPPARARGRGGRLLGRRGRAPVR